LSGGKAQEPSSGLKMFGTLAAGRLVAHAITAPAACLFFPMRMPWDVG
jgi:hypothetical protein